MFKKLLAILLVCLLALPCGISMAEEAETLISGDFEYTLNGDGSATITEYNGEADALTIPAELDGHSVTAIGNKAFSGNSTLTSVAIPDSVTSIGTNPFADCEKLMTITVSPDHPALATIDGVLFEKATRTLVCYPCAFTDEAYAVPQGIQAIGDSAFYKCGSLTDITLPDSLTSIGDQAFLWCSSLTDITLPDGLASIGDQAFFDCDSLTSVTIPNSVTSVGVNPFIICDQLTQINVSPDHPTLAVIDGVLFDKAGKTLICYPCALTQESYAIPQGMQAIGDSAFRDCTHLTSVTIPDSVTSIGNVSFVLCKALTSVTVPASVTSIGNSAFHLCGLLTLTVPQGSRAAEYAEAAGIPYTYTDSLDWLNG